MIFFSVDFGAFITDLKAHSASAFVSEISSVFPAFHDVANVGDTEVPFLTKAQSLAASLYLRFCHEDGIFATWKSLDDLSVLADYKLVSFLLGRGVLVIDDVPSPPDSFKLQSLARAAAVVAVHELSDSMGDRSLDAAAVQRILRRMQKKDRADLVQLPCASTVFF